MNPPAWRRTTYVVAATQLFVLTGFGLALPFLPLYIQELGVSDPTSVAWWTGVMSAASGFTMAAPRPIRFFRIAWRAHNVTASLTVQAFEGDVSLADALSLARLQQRRIETA